MPTTNSAEQYRKYPMNKLKGPSKVTQSINAAVTITKYVGSIRLLTYASFQSSQMPDTMSMHSFTDIPHLDPVAHSLNCSLAESSAQQHLLESKINEICYRLYNMISA